MPPQTTHPILVVAMVLSTLSARAAEPEANDAVTLTPAETQFIALAEDFSNKLNEFWEQAAKISDEDQSKKFYAERDPAIEYLPKFLAFERENAGQDVGLDALGEIVSYASRGGSKEWPGYEPRREVLRRLPAYEDRDLVAGVIVRLTGGVYDPQVIEYLRRVAISTKASPTVRACAQFELAKALLSLRASRNRVEVLLESLGNGMPAPSPLNETYFREYLENLPSDDELAADQAIPMLEELATTAALLRRPAFRGIDTNWHLRRIDDDQTKTAVNYSELASAVLFKEQHLRPGRPAPELEVELIDGTSWRLADQIGRVTVVQFSFTGCGPCEQMYPGMREMAQEFGDRLSMLTILRDETPDDGQEALKSGKITWPVACDGPDFKRTTQWAVDGFPEVYVIDRAGRIAAVGPRDKQLRWHVARLAESSD